MVLNLLPSTSSKLQRENHREEIVFVSLGELQRAFPGMTAEGERLLKWIAKGEDAIVGKGGAVKIYHSDVSGPVGTRCYPKIENLGIRVKAGQWEAEIV